MLADGGIKLNFKDDTCIENLNVVVKIFPEHVEPRSVQAYGGFNLIVHTGIQISDITLKLLKLFSDTYHKYAMHLLKSIIYPSEILASRRLT